MLEGEVLQQPTIPVVKETNMMKKATMNKAIMARPMSEIKKNRNAIRLLDSLGTFSEDFKTLICFRCKRVRKDEGLFRLGWFGLC